MTLYEMLRFDEGEKLQVYKDTEGYWTVGIGHLLTKNPSKEQAIACLDKELNRVTSGVISKSESEQLFNQDISRALQDISRSELSSIYIQMNGHRRAALVNMVFQLGLAGVLKFRKMIQYLKVGNYEAAADEGLDSKWARQTPNRARRVTEVIRTGTFSSYS